MAPSSMATRWVHRSGRNRGCRTGPSPAPSAPSTTNGKPLLVGVNLSGAGFGPSVVPGTRHQLHLPGRVVLQVRRPRHAAGTRLPFLWERIQPKLNYAAECHRTCAPEAVAGFRAEAQRQGDPRPAQLLPLFQQADRLERSTHQLIRGSVEADCAGSGQPPAVEGYGLMNEPHSTNGLWPEPALAAAQAIPHRGFQALDLRGR